MTSVVVSPFPISCFPFPISHFPFPLPSALVPVYHVLILDRVPYGMALTKRRQDTKATQVIITNVRDSIFRGYLKESALV